ncbi:hypothetical protein ALQ74_103389 [Pseudomonas savastanoi pv. glycinea]|uniref:Uncharacterized protein n=2 Tax=Pseudomonas savastanoi TaxID=29438 RepID=A0A3M3FLY7_PSESG|nr:hypothetical protein ALO55_103326 [Pseudomonas savastanoi pv. phaseolicola]RMM62918.1 hypothetical protein ALQ74_103389 [Pseudomonas savastanoi pv. glycinea]RMQ55293.1 hypothetical protein ALQ02_102858 [Pseudomonas savastanoi pv. phaseolicola]RMT09223.1 hypothetical protein ALP53_102980 [Pseudomonas savastanoi pv. phaseolicola]
MSCALDTEERAQTPSLDGASFDFQRVTLFAGLIFGLQLMGGKLIGTSLDLVEETLPLIESDHTLSNFMKFILRINM